MVRCGTCSSSSRPPTPTSARPGPGARTATARPCRGGGRTPRGSTRRRTCPALLEGVDLVVVRLLGGRQAWEAGLDALLDTASQPRPVVVLGGEQAPDAQLMESSTVPVGVATQAHLYLAQGGPDNLRELAAFLSDTVLLTGHGFAPPEELPTWGRLPGWEPAERANGAVLTSDVSNAPLLTEGGRPRVAVVYYRAHHVAGNTAFVDALCRAVVDAGGVPEPLFCSSLRAPDDGARRAPARGRRPDHDGARRRWLAARVGVGRRGRRVVGHRRARRPRRPDPAGPLPHPQPRGVARRRRRREPPRRRQPGRGPGVRRPDHHGALLLQGDRRGRAAGLRRRPRAGRARRRARRQPRPAAPPAERGQEDRPDPRPPTRRSTRASATRSGSTPRPPSSPCCTRCATRATSSGRPSSPSPGSRSATATC